MTNDYKETLLKYMTGKLENETGVNEPQFSEYKITNNNTRKQIADELETTIDNIRIRGNLSSNDYNTVLLYGFNVSDLKTFIGVFTKDMILIQLIKTFSSGSDLFTIISMQIAEDGRLYGLSQDSSNNNYTLRVLLFNNIFASGEKSGEYSVILRNDYIVPSTDNFRCINLNTPKDVIKKVPGESIYYITGYPNDNNNTYTKVIKFQINIGSSNTWDTYTIGTNVYYAQSKFTVLLNKEGDSYAYYAYGLDVINSKYVVYKIDSEGNVTNISSINLIGSVSFTGSQVLAINDETVYVSVDNSTNKNNSLYKVSNNLLILIETTPWQELPDELYQGSYYYLQKINNNVFVTRYTPSRFGMYIHFGMIVDTTIYYKEDIQGGSLLVRLDNFNNFIPYNDTYINNQYNLYNIYINSDYNLQSAGTFLNKVTLIYNQNNYNGLPYKALNSLIPNSGILYDNDDDVIFARNLYNKTVSGATTTSTVQIPNTLLNDTTIAKSDLIGQTNMELVNDTTQITKNIYETVDLNFSNTLVIRNDNDENNKILNPIGSSRLNNSVSQTIDYENAQATKLRVNYADGTNEVIEFSSTQIKLVSNYTAKYVFSIYVKKEITNIQIISHDENTVYQTINNLSLTVGKIYNFIQYVSMLEEIIRDNVLYNSETINYNNEPVLYIN